ncbi:hypothetical protein BC936DRAFT_145290 [Jimgerdemannia flammicorona]|uniref:Uncharacterized protein n=1 Tax=Jimgerdemannia flammicorona TaxID=994334 RepID=A0A433DAC9_9FUNG|nr:hypothetical protein BC936DRAFT_145290 [Jimgerdemannia flammicorona]
MSIGLVVACADYKLRFIDNDQRPMLASGHTDYVNHVAFNVTRGASVVASVSDDKTCRIWTTVTPTASEPACLHIIRLSSPGIAASWHREQAQFLMIAERSGQIRVMDWVRLETIWVVSLNGGPGAGPGAPEGLSGLDANVTASGMVGGQPYQTQAKGGMKWAEWKAGDASCFGAVIGSKWHLWNLRDSASAFPEQSGERGLAS